MEKENIQKQITDVENAMAQADFWVRELLRVKCSPSSDAIAVAACMLSAAARFPATACTMVIDVRYMYASAMKATKDQITVKVVRS
jgi:hypothetical protein